jgi:hypothetical protein
VREQENVQRQRLSRTEGHASLEPEAGRATGATRSSSDEGGVRRGPRASIE